MPHLLLQQLDYMHLLAAGRQDVDHLLESRKL